MTERAGSAAVRVFSNSRDKSKFDDSSLVGFTREGVGERPDSGAAVILTDGAGGSKRMYVGAQRLARLGVVIVHEGDGAGRVRRCQGILEQPPTTQR